MINRLLYKILFPVSVLTLGGSALLFSAQQINKFERSLNEYKFKYELKKNFEELDDIGKRLEELEKKEDYQIK